MIPSPAIPSPRYRTGANVLSRCPFRRTNPAILSPFSIDHGCLLSAASVLPHCKVGQVIAPALTPPHGRPSLTTIPPIKTAIPPPHGLRFDPFPSTLGLPARPQCPSSFHHGRTTIGILYGTR